MAAKNLKSISTPKKKKEQRVKVKHVKPRAESRGTVVKPFAFVSAENKWLGPEPTWNTAITNRNVALAKAFTWYGYYFQNKEAKPMLLQWLEVAGRRDEAKTIKTVHESEYALTPCWLARMSLMGLEFTERERESVECEIARLQLLVEPAPEADSVIKKPGIQDHIRNKTLDIAGELDGIFDDFVRAGAKTITANPIDVMRSMNLVPNQVPMIQEIWNRELTELKLAQTDKEVAECYDGYTKIQLRNMVKFAEQVLADCASYIAVKKVERKPRAQKPKSPEHIARGFKYLKEDTTLRLKSEPPAKIIAAQEAWLYDTAKRKLIHVVADSNAGSLTIKGASIVGYDERTTVMKTIRKPETQLKEVFAGGKPATRKAFGDIATTEAKWSGRSNENIIILKVW